MVFARDVLISLRPKQWYKNSLLFVCLVFAGHLQNASMWTTLLLSAAFFCLLTSCEYIINDIFDREKDSKHPVKKNRPIAAGRVGVRTGILIASALGTIALVGSYFMVNFNFFCIAAGYLALLLLYTLVLKHIIIADVITIAMGFVIRAVAGCLAIDVTISPWLIICTFLLAMFLALEKRWDELVLLADDAEDHRPTLSQYSTTLLEHFTTITVAATIVAYLMYATLAQHYAMMLTVPFAIYGLLRYMYLVHYKKQGGDPVVLFRDKALMVNLAIWGLLMLVMSLWGILV